MALASAVAADIITPAERGAYLGMASLGNILAPSLGPVLGGLLSQYWGWSAIFWLLVILSSCFFFLFALFFPETCRVIVGDGSVCSPSAWNRPLWSLLFSRKNRDVDTSGLSSAPSDDSARGWKVPNPWSSLRLLFARPVGLLLFANGVVFGSYYAVTAGIPAQFEKIYRLDDFRIGLCFLPAGLGSLLSAVANGFIVDWNYRRMSRVERETAIPSVEQDTLMFPVERARLQICLPMAVSFVPPAY